MLIKKIKDENISNINSIERELSYQKDINTKSQTTNDLIAKEFRDKIAELTLQISNKDQSFMRDKDQTLQELVSHESTIRTIQYDLQKSLNR